MKRDRILETVMEALNKYYGNMYDEYAKENDKNNGLRVVLEAVDTANYVKENLK